MCVKDMLRSGHRVVFEQDDKGNDLSHAIHRKTLDKVNFIPVGDTWDLEMDLIPRKSVETALAEAKHLATLRPRQCP